MNARLNGVLDYREMVRERSNDFRVRPEIYRDPAIFEDEMRNIFERIWVYVGHESEIENPGAFRAAFIGRQPVILCRGQDGKIRVFFNVCRHRGNAVCREERGRAEFFRCPYHGWTYATTGALTGVSDRKGYGEDFGKDLPGLLQAPRLGVYRGLIFASLSAEGESLESYLKDVRPYIDLWVERSPTGVVRARAPHKSIYPGNWKFQAENGADGYHPSYVHESAFKTFEKFGLRSSREKSKLIDQGSSMGFVRGHGWLSGSYKQSMAPAQLKEYLDGLTERYGAERAEEIATNRHVFIFPNVYLMDVNIRVIYPVSVDQTVVYSYYTALDGVSDEINRQRLRDLQRRLSTTGMIASDDMEIFAGNQTGLQAQALDWINLSRGLQREARRENGAEAHYTDETPQRALYQEWRRLMTMGMDAWD